MAVMEGTVAARAARATMAARAAEAARAAASTPAMRKTLGVSCIRGRLGRLASYTFQGGLGFSGKENHLMVAPATTIPVREEPSRAMIPERSGWFEQYSLPFTLK